MIIIGGINHQRFVGIRKDSGAAEDFYAANAAGYRPPKTPAECAACEAKAQEYYISCLPETRTGDFEVTYMSDKEQSFFVKKSEEYARRLAEFAKKHIGVCPFCGEVFFKNSPRQKTCLSITCARRRKAANMAACRARKKNNPSQDPA